MNIAYGYGFTKEDETMLCKMMGVVRKDDCQVIDLGSYDPKGFNSDDLCFLFGQKADKKLHHIDPIGYKIGRFPDIKSLRDTPANTESRKSTLQALLLFKKRIESPAATTPSLEQTYQIEDLPELPADDIRALENNLIAKGIKEWYGKTVNGKTIHLSVLPMKDVAEVNMTFSELYAMRAAFANLGMKEIKVVCYKT